MTSGSANKDSLSHCVPLLLCMKVTQGCVSFSQARASRASDEEESNNTPSGWEFLCACVQCLCVICVWACRLVFVLVFEGGSYSTRGRDVLCLISQALYRIRCCLLVFWGVYVFKFTLCACECMCVFVVWSESSLGGFGAGISDAAGQEAACSLELCPSLWTLQHTLYETYHFICMGDRESQRKCAFLCRSTVHTVQHGPESQYWVP